MNPWEQVLGHFLTMGVMAVLTSYASRPAKRDPLNGDAILKYSWPLRIFTWCILAGFGLIFIAGLVVPLPRLPLTGLIIGETFMGLLTGFLAYSTLHFTWDRIVLNDKGITRDSAWRFPLTIAWSDVAKVSYSARMDWFIVTSRGGDTIRIFSYIAGWPDLEREVRARLPLAIYEDARAGFAKLRSPQPW